jgi:hypothetical protein
MNEEQLMKQAEESGLPHWSARSILDNYGNAGLEEAIAAAIEDEELQETR